MCKTCDDASPDGAVPSSAGNHVATHTLVRVTVQAGAAEAGAQRTSGSSAGPGSDSERLAALEGQMAALTQQIEEMKTLLQSLGGIRTP